LNIDGQIDRFINEYKWDRRVLCDDKIVKIVKQWNQWK